MLLIDNLFYVLLSARFLGSLFLLIFLSQLGFHLVGVNKSFRDSSISVSCCLSLSVAVALC